jgi:hypothetical protein
MEREVRGGGRRTGASKVIATQNRISAQHVSTLVSEWGDAALARIAQLTAGMPPEKRTEFLKREIKLLKSR